jgi:hypothetical protein
MFGMKRFLSMLVLVLFTFTAVSAKSEKVIRILAIGNSFSEDAVEQYLYELGKDAGYELIIGNAYRGGQGLESHWKDVSTFANTFEYRKVAEGGKTNTRSRSLRSIIEDEPWDYITLQQVSQDSGRPETFEPFLTYLINYVKMYATNKDMKLGYHMTWAYSKDSSHGGFVNYGRDQMTMYNAICNAVKEKVKTHREFSFLVPSGTAIQNARTSRLGDTLNRDGFHLDYNVGRYTAACTWLEAVLRRNVLHNGYKPEAVSAEDAEIARRAAHYARRTPFKIHVINEK